MRIMTTAAGLTDLTVICMADLDPATLEPAKAYGTDDVQLVDGAPVYRLPAVYVRDGDREARGVSIKVRNRPSQAIAELTRITLTGDVSITPWVRDGRVAYSILADSVEAVK